MASEFFGFNAAMAITTERISCSELKTEAGFLLLLDRKSLRETSSFGNSGSFAFSAKFISWKLAGFVAEVSFFP